MKQVINRFQLALILISILANQNSFTQTISENFGNGEDEFSIEFVMVGNPGNNPDSTGYGSVSSAFNIAKYEISRQMIEKANIQGNLGITMSDLTEQPAYGGNGSNRPATGVGLFEAVKFVNWLNTSRGYAPAYNVDNAGNLLSWASSDLGYNSSNPNRNNLAKFWVPNADEWYKAAYSDQNNVWYAYPTGSNSIPVPMANGVSESTAVYGAINGFADVQNAGGLSPWGTMAQGGNAWEIMENGLTRGGVWSNTSSEWMLNTTIFVTLGFADEGFYDGGFRVASSAVSIPEPSALSFLAVGLGGLAVMRRRRS